MSIFLMGDAELQALRQEIKQQLSMGQPRQKMQAGTYREDVSDSTVVLRIHGPVLSRQNWITELLGLRTTEEHLDTLSSILATGSNALLDIDTGDGDASLAFELADMIRQGGDRVQAYSGGYAASAGMLFLTAASKAYAHRSATLGSIGVVGFANFDVDDDAIYSDNAANKKPNRASVQRDINETENLFHEYVSQGTGLSREQVISLGNQGDIFSGQSAATNGFITGTTTLHELASGKTALAENTKMLAFVAQQLAINPKVTTEQMLQNYMALYNDAGQKKASKDDDWESRLEFIRTRGKGGPKQDQPPAQQPEQQPEQQPARRQRDTFSPEFEKRLEFIRTRAREAR